MENLDQIRIRMLTHTIESPTKLQSDLQMMKLKDILRMKFKVFKFPRVCLTQ